MFASGHLSAPTFPHHEPGSHRGRVPVETLLNSDPTEKTENATLKSNNNVSLKRKRAEDRSFSPCPANSQPALDIRVEHTIKTPLLNALAGGPHLADNSYITCFARPRKVVSSRLVDDRLAQSKSGAESGVIVLRQASQPDRDPMVISPPGRCPSCQSRPVLSNQNQTSRDQGRAYAPLGLPQDLHHYKLRQRNNSCAVHRGRNSNTEASPDIIYAYKLAIWSLYERSRATDEGESSSR